MNVKKIFIFFIDTKIILFLLLFVCSCSVKPIYQPSVTPDLPEAERLFREAEKLFQLQSYDDALKHYEEYITKFPNASKAPASFMKIGLIYIQVEQYEKATHAFENLIDKYPDSFLVSDAIVNMLLTFYKNGQYVDIIKKSDKLLKKVQVNSQIIRVYDLKGDAYIAIDKPDQAISPFLEAYKKASYNEKNNIIEKMKRAISLLDSDQTTRLIRSIPNDPPLSYLLYHLGAEYIKERKRDKALEIFTKFLEQFPNHEYSDHVKQIIEGSSLKPTRPSLTIGCLLPLSGKYQIFGQKALRGIETAMYNLNSKEPFFPVKLILKDTESDPIKAAECVDELERDNVMVIIGPIITSEEAVKKAQLYKIPIVVLSQKANITHEKDYVFRNFLTPKMQAKAIVSYATEELGLTRFAILYPDDDYGNFFMKLFWDEVIFHKGIVAGAESYDPDESDFTTPIKKLTGLYYNVPRGLHDPSLVMVDNKTEHQAIIDFEAVFIPDAPTKAGLIIPQLVYNDVKGVYFLGPNIWNSSKFIDMLGNNTNNILISESFYADSSNQNVKTFVENYKELYGEIPGFIEAITNDTVHLICFAVNDAQDPLTRQQVRDSLISLKGFKGITGMTYFDHQGDAQKKLHILTIQNNKFITIDTYLNLAF